VIRVVASFIAIASFFVCMIVFACKRCTSLEDRGDFLDGAEEIVSSALLFAPLAPLLSTKRLGVAGTLLPEVEVVVAVEVAVEAVWL